MRLYLDTSVFSAYYDERAPERMQMTRASWRELEGHDRICSDVTLEELGQATRELAHKLLALTSGFKIVSIDGQTRALAEAYIEEGVVSRRHLADALQIAAAVKGNADILLSWNFKHLVRRSTRLLVNYVNVKQGLRSIEILAPPEI